MNIKLLTCVMVTSLYTAGTHAETITYNGFDYYGYGAGELGLKTAAGIIEAFCLGPPTPVLWSGTYNEEILARWNPYPELAPLSNAQVGEIGALVLGGEQWIASDATPEAAAAIAIAIWRVEGYGLPYSVSSFSDASSAWINTEADWYYNAATSGALAPFYNISILYQSGNQPLVTLTPPAILPHAILPPAIPAASTWLMMLMGLSVLGWAAFRGQEGAPPRRGRPAHR